MSKITHPNFRIKDQKNPTQRMRAVMVYLDQDAFDCIMYEVDCGLSKNPTEVIEKALRQYCGGGISVKEIPSESS